MINNNKILTVSYGTFSCTLEGFEDSFGTMKAIAEYFRDLAADDRYFGAEPPQPDVEMLARIAEREVSRRVEAREKDGRFMLRAHDAVPPAAAAGAAARGVAEAGTAPGPAADAPVAEDAAKDDVAPAVEEMLDEPMQDLDIEMTGAAAGGTATAPAEASADTADIGTESPTAIAPEADIEVAADAVAEPVAEELIEPAALPEPEPAPVIEPDVAVETEVVETEVVETASAPEPVAEAAAEPAAEDVAERQPVAVPEPEIEAEIEAAGEIEADEPADIAAEAAAQEAQPETLVVEPDTERSDSALTEETAPAADTVAAAAEDDFGDMGFRVEEVEAPKETYILKSTPRESIAAKLQRIRDVVLLRGDRSERHAVSEDADEAAIAAAQETVFAAGDDVDEDIHAVATHADESDLTVEAAARDIEEALAEDDALAVSEDQGAVGDDLDGFFESLDRVDAAEAPTAEVEEAPQTVAVSYQEYDEDYGEDYSGSAEVDLSAFRAVVESADVAPKAPEQADDTADNLFADDASGDGAADDGETMAFDSILADDQDEELEIEAEFDVDGDATDSARDGQPQIIRVKRSDLEAAIAAGEIEEYEAEESQDDDAVASTLSAEDEDELNRDLAEVEADLAREAALEAQAARNALRRTPQAEDEDLSRLMAEAEHQMEDPESADRRQAFAHLRAAVAAKKADEALGEGENDEDTDAAYRDDLAAVVKPRRPVPSEQRSDRRAEIRPAPLKLVAEQRIDLAAVRAPGPVRPRRIPTLTDEDAAPEADTGFAEFAETKGATALPDLLEAAAAYLSFVEGHEHFSRQQLMQQLRQVRTDEFSREDSLRSFGQLLRSGKIQKIHGGQFTASDRIGFKPGHRAAG